MLLILIQDLGLDPLTGYIVVDLGFHNWQEILWQAKLLLTSEEGFCSKVFLISSFYNEYKYIYYWSFVLGFLEPSATAIVARDAGNVLLDWSADVTLENLTVDAHSMQMAMSIRNGTVWLRNCRIVGGNVCSTGILVLKGGYLEAQSCEFVNFGIGLVLDHAAQVSLKDCNITSCNIGIKVSML